MPYIDREDMARFTELSQFVEKHGSVVSNALRVYSEQQRKAGEEAMAGYRHVVQCPMARDQLEKPDKEGRISIMTVEGLRMSGEMILQSADNADDAYKDLETIENGPYEDDDTEDE